MTRQWLINILMSGLRDYLEVNTIRRLTEQQQDELALMVANGEDDRLSEWCDLNEVSMDRVKKWARTGALAAGLAASGGAAKAGDDIPDYIRKKANQTQFSQQAQQAQTRGKEAARINQDHGHGQGGHWNNHGDDRRWDDDNERWVHGGRHHRHGARTGIWYDPYYNPYQGAMVMHNRMVGQRYPDPYAGQNPYMEPDQPQPGEPYIDSEPGGPPEGEAVPPEQDIQSRTITYRDINGKKIKFMPYPTPIELAQGRYRGLPIKKIYIKDKPDPVNAYVWDEAGWTHVMLIPGQLD